MHGVRDTASTPAAAADLQLAKADDTVEGVDRNPHVPALRICVPGGHGIGYEGLGVVNLVRPPRLEPTSLFGRSPLVDGCPVGGRDTAQPYPVGVNAHGFIISPSADAMDVSRGAVPIDAASSAMTDPPTRRKREQEQRRRERQRSCNVANALFSAGLLLATPAATEQKPVRAVQAGPRRLLIRESGRAGGGLVVNGPRPAHRAAPPRAAR